MSSLCSIRSTMASRSFAFMAREKLSRVFAAARFWTSSSALACSTS